MALGLAENAPTIGSDAILDSLGSTAPWIELHTADPGAAGTTARAGGGSGLVRKQATWNAAVGGSKTNSADLDWTEAQITTTETLTHFTMWTASTAGTFHASGTIDSGTGVSVNASGDAFRIPASALTLSLNTAA